jgi:hypothetical protein
LVNFLKDNINDFSTGDFIFTRYPRREGGQPIHVTVFLEPKDSPGGGAAYVHAGADYVEVSAFDTYADDPGYLHVKTQDTTLRAKTAQVAKIFAPTALDRRTPYGSFPQNDRLPRGAAAPNASRYRGMMSTQRLADIPFEFAALQRLLKWTHKAMTADKLSKERGITCAAFGSACIQVAAMLNFLESVYKDKDVDGMGACVEQLRKLTAKPDTWDTRTLIATLEPKKVHKSDDDPLVYPAKEKKIFRDQALRANSNRQLTAAGSEFFTTSKDRINTRSLDLEHWRGLKTMDLVERLWLIVQTQILKISEWQARPLSDIIPANFFFDAKYVNSLVLSELLEADRVWAGKTYTMFSSK